MGEGDVEEVVPGHADAQSLHPLRCEQPVQDPLVVRIRGLLRIARRRRPARNLGVHGLHRQVGALDETDLDPDAAVLDAAGGEFAQALHRSERVGLVGLDDDSGFEFLELRFGEQTREHGDRQLEVLVLLHIEVDELRAGRSLRRLAVEGTEAFDDVVDGLVEGPHRDLRGHGGDLHRDIVDVVAGEQPVGLLQVVVGFAVTEHGLAEEVDVESVTIGGECGHGLAELLVAGVDDHVTDHLAQARASCGDDDLRSDLGERSTGLDLRTVEVRHRLGCELADLGQRVGGGVDIIGAHDPIDESDGEVEPVLIGEDGGEAFGCGVLRRGHRRRHSQPPADGVDRLGGELVEVGFGVQQLGSFGARCWCSHVSTLTVESGCEISMRRRNPGVKRWCRSLGMFESEVLE